MKAAVGSASSQVAEEALGETDPAAAGELDGVEDESGTEHGYLGSLN